MRAPRTQQHNGRTPRLRTPQKSEGHRLAPDDVLWWADINRREPFITAAQAIRQQRKMGRTVHHVLWRLDNSMHVVAA